MMLQDMLLRHRIKPRGIIHVGAHWGEEAEEYRKMGVDRVLWIEADPVNVAKLREPIPRGVPQGHGVICACLSDANEPTTFYRTNEDGYGSSILPIGTMGRYIQTMQVEKEISVQSITFSNLAERYCFNVADYDFLVLDVQGAELKVLRGFGAHLDGFQGILAEVATEQIYTGMALLPEMDAWLAENGFQRRELVMAHEVWGDALYLRA